MGSGGTSFLEAGPKVVEGGVRFVYFAPKAKRVNITGDFNNWSTVADPMFNRERKGEWSITMPLKAGRYEYKFLVDGEKWVPDPGNPNRVKDGFGALNSVVEVEP
jgi:1,4-alpha-glucan branching enzyme